MNIDADDSFCMDDNGSSLSLCEFSRTKLRCCLHQTACQCHLRPADECS